MTPDAPLRSAPICRRMAQGPTVSPVDELNGKVAVITGGASGIGLALAERFGAEGMRVVLADVDEPRLRNVEARMSESGIDVTSVVCDTSTEADVEALAQSTLERFGAAHVLCNNAGIAGMGDPWRDPMALWERIVGINVFGVVHGIRAFLPIMQDQGEGHIVNTASMAGLMPAPGAAPYAATKHAVVALSESLHLELLALGSPVGISALCPAFVKTRLMEHEPVRVDDPLANAMNEILRSGVEGGIPASDVADQVVDAIRARRFWVLTHPDMRQVPVERMQRAANQENPGFTASGDP
jgi:NAD(P)-dependent dehydrogenase (short-subunit alcohol dehydrogenase family)